MNKIQTQFELSELCKNANLAQMNGKYVNPTVQKMWLGWNACANQYRLVAWLRVDELEDLKSCNYRQLGADSPTIWYNQDPDEYNINLIPAYTLKK